MKAFRISLLFLLVLTLLSTCGEIKKQIAGEQILGSYSGKVTYIFKHSLQNVGLGDETKELQTTVTIYKNSANDMFIKTVDGNIKLSGVTLAANGTTFGIPFQNVLIEEGTPLLVQGFQVAELEGVKFDGIYYSENNILNFGYHTIINYDYWGTKANLGVECTYELSKVN